MSTLGQPVPLMTKDECIDRLNNEEDPYDVAIMKWERIVRHHEWKIPLYEFHAHGETCSLCYKYQNKCDRCLLLIVDGSICNGRHSMWRKYTTNMNATTANNMIKMLKKAKRLYDIEQLAFRTMLEIGM